MKFNSKKIDMNAEVDCQQYAMHHHTSAVATRLQLRVFDQPVRKPIPVAAIYNLDNISQKPCDISNVAHVEPAGKQPGSIKNKAERLDKDPFLQRLSRLN